MTIIPYTELDGIRTFNDTVIKDLYRRMVEEGTAKRVFFDGSVSNEEAFLNMFKHNPENHLFVIKTDGEPAAIAWLNGVRNYTATAHFCLFKRVWGKKGIEVGKRAIQFFLNMKDWDGRYYHDVITGLTPSCNRLAVRWIQKIGMKILGEIPNVIWDAENQESVPGVISYITREA